MFQVKKCICKKYDDFHKIMFRCNNVHTFIIFLLGSITFEHEFLSLPWSNWNGNIFYCIVNNMWFLKYIIISGHWHNLTNHIVGGGGGAS